MSDPFLGEIRIVSWNFAPRGWAFCNGQLMPINQNQALFALLGTTYGGNGQTTFALPDLRGRTPIHAGGGHVQGEAGGEENHTLTAGEMAAHSHTAQAGGAADQPTPAGNFWADGGKTNYAGSPDLSMSPLAIGSAGGSQPHANLPPYLVLNFVIALTGIFPSRS